MANRFSGLFNLSEEQAIEILDSEAANSDEASNRYIAASHLVNFDSESAVAALIRAVERTESDLDNRIVRRKAVESLGRLQATEALSVIAACLADEDNYLVENAAWAIAEIGTEDADILERLSTQLDRPNQSYRTLIHALASLGYEPAADRIAQFLDSDSAPIASAAQSAMYQLKGDESGLKKVLGYLQSPNVNARRGSIQDLSDAGYYKAIPNIAQCPVSMVFRLRAIRSLAQGAIAQNKTSFTQVRPILEKVLRDHPKDVALVHRYDQVPSLEDLIQELYGTDFGRCYLAARSILETYADTAAGALRADYEAKGYNDYGAHYHIMRLFGWLQETAAFEVLIKALHNKAPQFQKSRVAAAIALGELGNPDAIPELKKALSVPIWDLQYSAILALVKLGETDIVSNFSEGEPDWLIQEKLATL